MSDFRQKTNDILNQLGLLISRLTGEEYARPLSCLQENSIGKHVRHMVEFFECLLEGIPSGEVNYDLRKRNLRIETDPAFTLHRITLIQQEITCLQDASLLLKADLGNGTESFQTSVYRELAFTMDHCVHHLALVRVGLQQHFPNVKMDQEVGVAFSTLRYLQQQQA
jgi:hypothetical protein